MPDFILNRNHSLRTPYGHVIDFKKGQPTYVPPICVREAAAIGAECVDGPVEMLDPEAAPEIPMSLEERQENILAAFKVLEEAAGREDFSASGMPTKEALVKVLGFAVDKKEFEPLWTAYLAEKGVEE